MNVPSLPTTQRIATATLGFANALLLALYSLGAFHWTDAQKGLVWAEVNAGVGLTVALIAHFRTGTAREPVAVSAATTAFIAASLGVAVGFNAVAWTDQQIGFILGLVTSAFALGGAFFVRNSVLPMAGLTGTQPGPPPQGAPGDEVLAAVAAARPTPPTA